MLALLSAAVAATAAAPSFGAGTAPAWEPDGNAASYGQIVFYDANGDVVTSGTDYNNPFAFAVAATAKDAGASTAQLVYKVPEQGVPPGSWNGQLVNENAQPVAGAPGDVAALNATHDVVAGGTAASLSTFNVAYPTTTVAGYQDVVQVRMTDSGPGGAGNSNGTYWESDVAINPGATAITVLGATVPPGGWAQVFPVVAPTSTTVLTTSATGGDLNITNPITLTADVTPVGGATGAGSVNFFDDTGSGPTLIGSGAVDASGTATYTYTPGGGGQSYTATFVPTLGDIQNPDTANATMTGGSTSSAVAVTVTAPATNTTVNSSGNSSVVGTAVTYTATITSAGGTPNGGTVAFQDGGSTIANCGSQPVSAGSASCVATPATAGAHSITAIYSPGTAPFAGSTSGAITQTVTQGTTHTTLSASPNPGGDGQNVTLTATVALATGAGTPTGTVQFQDNGNPITSPNDCSAVHLATLTVTCTTTLTAGTYSLSAVYSGDTNFTTSTGTTSEPVYPATVTTLASSSTGDTSVVGEGVTYSAVVASTSTVNAGTVAFTDGGSPIANCTTVNVVNGSAICDATPGSVGDHTIVATYLPGAAAFGGSVSNPLTQTVNQAATATTLGALTTSVTGQAVTYSAQVAVILPGSGTPTGTVTFSAGPTTLCTGTLNAGAVATCTDSSLVAANSPYLISAAYAGDADFAASSSSAARQTVIPASTLLDLTSSSGSSPSYTGETVTYQAVLSVVAPGKGTPTGAVVFKDGATTICTVALGPSLAVGCNETPSTAGPHVITAFYAGSSNFAAAPNASLTQTVQNQAGPTAPTAPTAPGASTTVTATPVNPAGYLIVGRDGRVFTFGGANYHGSLGGAHPTKPIVAVTSTPDKGGYWMVAANGGVFTFGDARFYGSLGKVHLAKPIVTIIPTHDGKGYWLIASDGGVFTFGDARFYGSLGKVHLAKPIVGGSPTADGKGYWLIAADGGVSSFGDAVFHGSLGTTHLTKPIVAIVPTADGGGYWLIAADGGVFSFGDAQYRGSVPGTGVRVTDVVGAA